MAASLSTKYVDSALLEALLKRIAEMYKSLKSYVDSEIEDIDTTEYVTDAEYDDTTTTINFKNSDGTVVSSIDASAFIVDGMISSVAISTTDADGNTGTYLHFVFNTDAGKEDIYVDVSELVNLYEAGNGIDITDSIVSVKISESSEEYLQVDENGLFITGVDDIKSRVTSLETWVDSNTVTEDEMDAMITELDETYEGFAEATGVTTSE